MIVPAHPKIYHIVHVDRLPSIIADCFPWCLVERIGVYSRAIYQQVMNAFPAGGHRVPVEIRTDWYY